MFFSSTLLAQDSLLTFTLEDVSIVDFRSDHQEVFKHIELGLNSSEIGLEATLEDALKKTIPVYFKNYSYGGIASIDFRGTGAERTQVYLNGVPINSPTLGSFDFSLLPSFLIEEAKIRFGGASIVDGGGGIGGSIQLNQNTLFKESKLEVIGSLGSFGNYSGGVKAQFLVNKFRSDTRVFYHQAENDFSFANTSKKDHPIENREHNQLSRFAIQQSMSYTFDKSNSMEINLLYSALDRNIPSVISSASLGAWQGDQLVLGQVVYNKLFANESYLKIRSSYQAQVNKYKNEGIDADNSVGAWNNKIDWGGKISKKIKYNTSFTYNLYDVNTDGTGAYSEQQYSGLLASDIQLTKDISTSFGIRMEGRDDELFPSMPFVGLAWMIPANIGKLKTNFSRVFRYPTINERYWDPGGNPDLNPEEGWNSELSYEVLIEKDRFSFQFQLTGFYSIINDWILWYPSTESPMLWQAQNLWKVNSKGIEWVSGVKWKHSNSMQTSLRILYSYNASTIIANEANDSSLDNKQLILVPQHMILLPLLFSFNSFSTGIDYQFTGIRYTDRNNSNYLDPYHLIDIRFSYLFKKANISVNFSLKNILNYSYQTYPGQPMPGLNYNLQLSWKLK